MADVHITGLEELNDFLKALPVKIERNVLRGALRAGAAKELLPEVQANVAKNGSIKTGEYIAGLRVGTRSRGGVVTAYVKAGGKHAYLGPWLEFGVKAHNIAAKVGGWLSFGGIFAKSVAHPGIRPRPHFRPALDSRGTAAVVVAAEYMRERLATKEGLDTAGITIAGDE